MLNNECLQKLSSRSQCNCKQEVSSMQIPNSVKLWFSKGKEQISSASFEFIRQCVYFSLFTQAQSLVISTKTSELYILQPGNSNKAGKSNCLLPWIKVKERSSTAYRCREARHECACIGILKILLGQGFYLIGFKKTLFSHSVLCGAICAGN